MSANRRGRIRRRPFVVLVLIVLLSGVSGTWATTYAGYVATTSSTGNSIAASPAANFPTYPAAVNTSAPTFYHRGEEATTTATSPSMVDAMNSNGKPGNLRGSSDGPAVWWRFDDDVSPTAQDFSGSVNNGTLTNTGGGTPPATTTIGTPSVPFSGDALILDASKNYLKGPIAPIDTSGAYSASVWVYLTSKASDTYALSMTGATNSVFGLGYNVVNDTWVLRSANDDTTALYCKNTIGALSPAVTNTWTNLAVTRAAGAGPQFWVNGVSITTFANVCGNWAAGGPLIAGGLRANVNLVGTNYWNGSIDEVKVYQRVLTTTELTAIAANQPAAEYGFNEEQGTTSADLSGNGNTANVSHAQWSSAGRSSGALSFVTGSSNYATAPASIDTTQSYTVSVLVRLNTTATTNTHGIVGEASSTNAFSGFILKYGTIGGYRSFTLETTSSTGGAVKQVVSTAASALGTWYWVTGVYDTSSATDQLRLYLNGTRADNAAGVTNTTPISSAKALYVGQTQRGSSTVPVEYLDGQVDAIRLFQSALTAAEVAALATEPANFTAGADGALQGSQQGQAATTSVGYSGMAGGYNPYNFASTPNTFTLECWFRTTTTTGGEIIGFSDKIPTAGVATKSDRMVYLEDSGKLAFVVLPSAEIRSTAAYNDGQWHHLAASMGAAATTGFAATAEPAGMRLYVDGTLVANNATTTGTTYSGYVRWGSALISGWTTTPTTAQFRGSLVEIAVYPTQLSHQDIYWHYYANH